MALEEPVERGDAERVVASVTALAGVACLHPGEFNEVALLYPGGRVRGLRLETAGPVARLEVHVVVDVSALPDLHGLAELIRARAREIVSYPVDVVFADAVDRPHPSHS